jgi:hypothetical protein
VPPPWCNFLLLWLSRGLIRAQCGFSCLSQEEDNVVAQVEPLLSFINPTQRVQINTLRNKLSLRYIARIEHGISYDTLCQVIRRYYASAPFRS